MLFILHSMLKILLLIKLPHFPQKTLPFLLLNLNKRTIFAIKLKNINIYHTYETYI